MSTRRSSRGHVVVNDGRIYFTDFSQISSKFAAIVVRFSRQGNGIPFEKAAAIVDVAARGRLDAETPNRRQNGGFPFNLPQGAIFGYHRGQFEESSGECRFNELAV